MNEEKHRLQIYDPNEHRLSCSIENKDCTLNCPSFGLCKHKRSASFDLRTLGNITQEIGGRQSWSGPVDDHSFMCRSNISSSQSTSNIPYAMDGTPPPFVSQTNFYNFKSPESCRTSCNSVGTRDDSQNIIYQIPVTTHEVNAPDKNFIYSTEVNHGKVKNLYPQTDAELKYGHCVSNGPKTIMISKPLCEYRDSM